MINRKTKLRMQDGKAAVCNGNFTFHSCITQLPWFYRNGKDPLTIDLFCFYSFEFISKKTTIAHRRKKRNITNCRNTNNIIIKTEFAIGGREIKQAQGFSMCL